MDEKTVKEKTGLSFGISIRILNEDDLDSILSIEDHLNISRELCLPSSKEEIEKCLSSECSCGVVLNGEIVAYSLCYYTEYCTGYIEKCYVDSSYRGHGFQRTLIEYNIGNLVSHNVSDIYSMVSPLNQYSLDNFIKAGFVHRNSTICEGHRRMILKFEL